MSEQLRVQIAEWVGYTHIQPAGSRRLIGFLPDHKGATEIPDFTGDLNAIASAEAKLSDKDWPAYLNALEDVTGAKQHRTWWECLRCAHMATALQRATALARVINQERV